MFLCLCGLGAHLAEASLPQQGQEVEVVQSDAVHVT